MTAIRLHMTALPVTVMPSTDVLEADTLMRQHDFHHLPVVEDGKILGVVSRRDIEAQQPRPGTPVETLLDAAPIIVDGHDDLGAVAGKLADARASVALVTEQGILVGLVTSTDLADVVAGRDKDMLPSALRREILRQHGALELRLSRIRSLVEWVRNEHDDAGPTLTRWLREFHVVFLAHLAQEEAHLLPTLKHADGFGPVRVTHLLEEHARQRNMLSELVGSLSDDADPQVICTRADKLVATMEADIVEEQRTALSPAVLKDDLVTVGFGG